MSGSVKFNAGTPSDLRVAVAREELSAEEAREYLRRAAEWGVTP